MKVLVVNCGSSSLKYQLIDMNGEKALAKGLFERIGSEEAMFSHERPGAEKLKRVQSVLNHGVALNILLDILVDEEHGVIKSMDEIDAVGHRVVNGAEVFNQSALVTEKAMADLEAIAHMAPLHNPANIEGIKACQEIMSNIPHVAVFDTAFHQTMPEQTYLYALPYELYTEHAVRRYGAHGTSHDYVAHRCAEIMDKPVKELNIVTCHLGNGSSISGVKGGKCIDTTMGYTPLAGVPMGTRSGDLDPAVVLFLIGELGMSAAEADEYLNKKSGVLGVSGVSNDFRLLESAAKEGNHRAQLALDMFHYRVRREIGALAAAMGGVDAIVFTAGIGENGIDSRSEIVKGLEFLGTALDEEANNCRGKEREISVPGSKVKMFVIPTNEEIMIARDTQRISNEQ